MAGRGTDIVLGGNPEMLALAQVRRRQAVARSTRRCSRASRRECARRARRGGRGGRPAHPRHRAPREPAHRQPAARPLRPPGRPGLEPVLPLARGRPAAHLRGGPRQAVVGPRRRRGGRGDREPPAHARDRERAEEGRGAQLRHPQAPARVRQRDEPPAPGVLRAAPRCARARGRRTPRSSTWPRARSSRCSTRTGPRRASRTPRRSATWRKALTAQFGVPFDPDAAPFVAAAGSERPRGASGAPCSTA